MYLQFLWSRIRSCTQRTQVAADQTTRQTLDRSLASLIISVTVYWAVFRLRDRAVLRDAGRADHAGDGGLLRRHRHHPRPRLRGGYRHQLDLRHERPHTGLQLHAPGYTIQSIMYLH